jgi:hypothetical protein
MIFVVVSCRQRSQMLLGELFSCLESEIDAAGRALFLLGIGNDRGLDLASLVEKRSFVPVIVPIQVLGKNEGDTFVPSEIPHLYRVVTSTVQMFLTPSASSSLPFPFLFLSCLFFSCSCSFCSQ